MILEREFSEVFGIVCIPKNALQAAIRGECMDRAPDNVSFLSPDIINFLDFGDLYSLDEETLKFLTPILIFGVLNVLEDDENPIVGSIFSLLDGYANPEIWDGYFLGIWGRYTVKQYDLILRAFEHLDEYFMPWERERIRECLFYLKVRAEEIENT